MKSGFKRLAYRLSEIGRNVLRPIRRSSPVVKGLEECTIVFVIASPRSGTTWLQRALNEHPQITCGENRLFGSHFDVVTDSSGRRLRITVDEFAQGLANRAQKQRLHVGCPQYADELTAGFARVAFEQWRKYSGKSVLVDKVTPYPGTAHETVKKIRTFFPGAKVIQLLRDGRDVATSGTFHWLKKSVEGNELDVEQQRRYEVFSNPGPDRTLQRFFSDFDLEMWAQTWVEPIRAVAGNFEEHVLQVRYEDMIDDMQETLEAICRHVDAEFAPEILNRCVKYSSFDRMSGGRRRGQTDPLAHVRKGVVGDWKNYFTRYDGELFQRLCGTMLKDLSFEPNPDWPQHLSESLNLRKAA